MKVLYIGCPYTDPDEAVKQKRYELATEVAAKYVNLGYIVYSPLTSTHRMDKHLAPAGTLGSDYWTKFNETFMAVCDEMIVIQAKGWSRSSGVSREMKYFADRRKKVSFYLPYGSELMEDEAVG